MVRKIKKKVSTTLHIDPNAGKEVEEDIVVTDEEIAEETVEVVEDAKEEVAEKSDKE